LTAVPPIPPVPPIPIAPLGGPPDDAELLDAAAEVPAVTDAEREVFVEPDDEEPPD
jgi:hypothetical protein